MKRTITIILIFIAEMHLSLGNSSFCQTRVIKWRDSDISNEQKFPFAYINDSTYIEKEINDYLKDKYLNQSESYRDNFNEYEVTCPNANICGVAITYEHEFNTSPGLWSFTDNNYFDVRSGKIIQIKSLIEAEKYDAFLKIVNERKNAFVHDFKNGLSEDQDDLERLHEIINYTLKEPIDSSDIDDSHAPSAMSSHYELTLYPKYLVLSYYWEYGWGLRRQPLPNISLKFTYTELLPLFNKYAEGLLLIPSEIHNKK